MKAAPLVLFAALALASLDSATAAASDVRSAAFARTANRPTVSLPSPNRFEIVRTGSVPLPRPAGMSLLPPADTSVDRYVYGCLFYANACGVYESGGTLVGSINGLTGPQGVDVDSYGYAYVTNTYANSGQGGQVLIYTPGGSTLLTTLSDPGQLPALAKLYKRTLAVSDFYSSSFGPGKLAVYKLPSRSGSPDYYVSDPAAYEGESVAFDSAGNCYWSYNTAYQSGPGHIDKFRNCARGARPVGMGITTQYAGGVAFDGSDNLWYTDQLAGTVNVCPAGGGACFVELSGFSDPVTLSWDGVNNMYVMDADSGIYQITILGDPYGLVIIPASELGIGVAVAVDYDTE
jgi:hypothetical protein